MGGVLYRDIASTGAPASQRRHGHHGHGLQAWVCLEAIATCLPIARLLIRAHGVQRGGDMVGSIGDSWQSGLTEWPRAESQQSWRSIPVHARMMRK